MIRPGFLAGLLSLILLWFLVSPGLALTVLLLMGLGSVLHKAEARRTDGG